VGAGEVRGVGAERGVELHLRLERIAEGVDDLEQARAPGGRVDRVVELAIQREVGERVRHGAHAHDDGVQAFEVAGADALAAISVASDSSAMRIS
jgi:hypothetical protein